MSQGRQIALEVSDFSFWVDHRPILRQISFSVWQGEYVSIIGPNGAGKTTLLKCLLGIYGGQEGSIRWFGQPLSHYSRTELAQRISYVPQIVDPLPPFSVEEFVLLGRYPYWTPFTTIGAEDRQAVRQAMEATQVSHLADRLLETLSGGERQKVLLAAALAQGAEVLLLDEPTTFLDYRHQSEIRHLLRMLNQQGRTILAVTHDVNPAALDSHRILALRDGSLVGCGPPQELMHPEVLQNIYGIRLLLVPHPTTGQPIIIPEVSSSSESLPKAHPS